MSQRNARERVPSGGVQSGSSVAKRRIGRYTFFAPIASGGMATVYFGKLSGQIGFAKTVAIKRPHPHLLDNPEFVNMFVDEARLAARIQHPNVVPTLDVVATEEELFLVMDYVHGDSLSHLLTASAAKGKPIAVAIACSILVNVLHGLHAAHEAVDEHGQPLGIVHRDVSPQNVIVGSDGVARVLDFGVAKAVGRLQSTSEGQLKGKVAFMAPEQIRGASIDCRTDVYAAAALLWGALTGRRLVDGSNEAELLNRVLNDVPEPPSKHAPHVPAQLDAIVLRGLAKDPAQRFRTAREMAIAIEAAVGLVSPYQVGEWVKSLAADTLALRASRVRETESASEVSVSMRDDGVAEVVHKTYDRSSSGISRERSPTHGSRTPPPYSATSNGDAFPDEPAAPPERSLASIVGIGALVFVVTFGGALAWLYGMLREPTALPEPTPPTSPTASVASTAQPVPPPPVTTNVPAAQPAVVELDGPDEASEPRRSPVAKPPATVTATKAPAPVVTANAPQNTASTAERTAEKPAATTRPKPKTVDCDSSPFFVDKDGIKRVRPECS